MADLDQLQAAQTVKIAGANASGVETNFLDVNSSGQLSISNFPTTVDVNSGNSSGNTLRVVVATNQSAIPVTQSTSPWVVSGTLTTSDIYSNFHPNPISYNTGVDATLNQDTSGGLMIRGPVISDEGSFRDDFGGSSLTSSKTGTVTFTNGSNVVTGSGTLFTTELARGDYIKKTSDSETLYVRIDEILSDTSLNLTSNYAGTTQSGQSFVKSNWVTTTATSGGGNITLSNSILTLTSGTTSGNIQQIHREGDYPPFNLIVSASITQRIANQTSTIGLADNPSSPGACACFQFSGTDNTKVTCTSSFSSSSGDTQTTLVTLPSSLNTSQSLIYEVDVTNQDVSFMVNKFVVARHVNHIPSPYQPLVLYSSIQNTSTVTTTNLNIDYIHFSNVDRLDVTNSFNGNPLKVGIMGVNSTTGLPVDLNVDSTGNLVVTSITGFGAAFSFGDVNTAALTPVIVRRTAYTEQTTNAQRSMASSSANDTAAGTGARQVTIVYYDSTGLGPFTETVTLNGTSYVNTTNTNICFIETMIVSSVGSTGSNVGVITLKAATAGGGATIWTMNATDNRAFSAHHYIPIGKTCNITGISLSHNGTTVGSGAVAWMRSKLLNNSTAPIIQVSDFVRLYGQSSTFARVYDSPIKVTGPARVDIFLTPETSSAVTYRAAFDFFEQ